MPTFKPWEISALPKLSKKDNRPEHYLRNGVDVIDFAKLQFSDAELKGFYRINVLKYVTRYDRKGGLADLEKARDYLNKLEELEKVNAN